MQINFVNTNLINKIIHIINEKEFDKLINAFKLSDEIIIKDKSYKLDYINVIPAELETMFSRINVYIHEIEE